MESKQDVQKKTEVRVSNIIAAKTVSDAIRTSLGPRGMDKMVVGDRGEITITNDGATIMKQLCVTHPCAKILVEVSKAQDVEAGDGTSSVVVLAGALLRAVETLLERGVHATKVSEAFLHIALPKALAVLKEMAVPVDINDRETLIKAAITSLASKVVSPNGELLAPMAVDAVKSVYVPPTPGNQPTVDLRHVRIVKALGGTLDDSELFKGLVLKQKSSKRSGAPTRIQKARVAMIQFCLSPPRSDIEQSVQISDYTQMDRHIREEREIQLQMCNVLKREGCNVVLIQKSILRDAYTDLSLDFLGRMKIMVVKDIERDDVEFICKTLGCQPIAHIDHVCASKFGTAELVEEVPTADGKIVKITGCPTASTMTVLLRGSSQLVLEEADRSLHDALCVVRSLVKVPAMLPGGGAAEVALVTKLSEYAKTLEGHAALCVRAFAEALEIVPFTLAENAGLRPMKIVTELRNAHAAGNSSFGVNVKRGAVSDMRAEGVVQPLLVSLSAISLASEAVVTILKIDDIVATRGGY